jgi:hypothetical protein
VFWPWHGVRAAVPPRCVMLFFIPLRSLSAVCTRLSGQLFCTFCVLPSMTSMPVRMRCVHDGDVALSSVECVLCWLQRVEISRLGAGPRFERDRGPPPPHRGGGGGYGGYRGRRQARQPPPAHRAPSWPCMQSWTALADARSRLEPARCDSACSVCCARLNVLALLFFSTFVCLDSAFWTGKRPRASAFQPTARPFTRVCMGPPL